MAPGSNSMASVPPGARASSGYEKEKPPDGVRDNRPIGAAGVAGWPLPVATIRRPGA